MLYQGMRDQGVGKAELARRLGWHLPQVDRILDIQRRSRVDQLDAGLGAIGRRLHVAVAASTTDSAPLHWSPPSGTSTSGRPWLRLL